MHMPDVQRLRMLEVEPWYRYPLRISFQGGDGWMNRFFQINLCRRAVSHGRPLTWLVLSLEPLYTDKHILSQNTQYLHTQV
jgi:hypothetical protein